MQDSPTQPRPELDGFTAYLINQRRLSPISVSAYRYSVLGFLSHLRENQMEDHSATPEIIFAIGIKGNETACGPLLCFWPQSPSDISTVSFMAKAKSDPTLG